MMIDWSGNTMLALGTIGHFDRPCLHLHNRKRETLGKELVSTYLLTHGDEVEIKVATAIAEIVKRDKSTSSVPAQRASSKLDAYRAKQSLFGL